MSHADYNLQGRPSPLLYVRSNYVVQSWAMAVRAVSTLSPTTEAAATTYVNKLIAAGLWDKMLMVDLCCGGDLLGSLVRIKVPSGVPRSYINDNFVSANYAETGATGGRKGDGATKSLNTLINPVTLGFSLQSLMLWSYCRETSPAGSSRVQIGNEGAAGNCYLGWVGVGTVEAARVSTITESAQIAVASTGLIGGGTDGTSRTVRLYFNGAQAAISPGVATGVYTNSNIRCHSSSSPTSTAQSFSIRRISQLIISAGLTAAECLSLYTIVQEFETALGRNV